MPRPVQLSHGSFKRTVVQRFPQLSQDIDENGVRHREGPYDPNLKLFYRTAERGRAIGTWSGFSAITAAAGPVFGGWLIEHWSWRAVFFLNVPLAALVVVLSLRFMDESRDESRTSRIDWIGAALAVLGLGAVVYALLEWPQTGANRSALMATLAGGVVALAAFVIVELRVPAPMLPMALFKSRTFTLTNLLTLLLYAALTVVFWLVPLNLIQVQHYSATAAGASLLPFPLLMFLLSRWSGGLVARVGSRLPLTAGPIIAAAGLLLFARAGIGGSYWAAFFPAVVTLGLGMSIVVAPLTTTVMGAVESQHAGVASGVNNAVARVAGLVAIAVFGLVLVRAFDARVDPALDRLELPAASRTAVDCELPKLAGADFDAALQPAHRAPARHVVDEAFVFAFRAVMVVAAAVALASAVAGWFISKP